MNGFIIIMNYQRLSHGRRGGSIAVYSSELYRVIAVSDINSHNSGSDSSYSHNSYSRQPNKDDAFTKIFDSELSKTKEPSNIQISTSGYTHFGMPKMMFINMRDYTYM